MKMLEGKGALVTGGSRGIGRAIVRRLASEGAHVVFNYANSAPAAAETEELVRAAGGRAHAIQADLSADGAVNAVTAFVEAHLDGLDILINNAALDAAPAAFADTDDLLYDRTMAVNARAPFMFMRFASRNMRDNGRIVNISSMNTVRTAPGISAYAASKGALEQLTKVAAAELGSRGITVNAVCPGTTDTDLLRHANSEATLARIPSITPLGRLGQPDDIADVVAMLAGPDARWITGQTVLATGGLV